MSGNPSPFICGAEGVSKREWLPLSQENAFRSTDDERSVYHQLIRWFILAIGKKSLRHLGSLLAYSENLIFFSTFTQLLIPRSYNIHIYYWPYKLNIIELNKTGTVTHLWSTIAIIITFYLCIIHCKFKEATIVTWNSHIQL